MVPLPVPKMLLLMVAGSPPVQVVCAPLIDPALTALTDITAVLKAEIALLQVADPLPDDRFVMVMSVIPLFVKAMVEKDALPATVTFRELVMPLAVFAPDKL